MNESPLLAELELIRGQLLQHELRALAAKRGSLKPRPARSLLDEISRFEEWRASELPREPVSEPEILPPEPVFVLAPIIFFVKM